MPIAIRIDGKFMRLMMLESPNTDTCALARDVAEHSGIPSIRLTTSKPEEWSAILARELEPVGSTEDFLLLVDLQSPDQAATLESILNKRGQPLELVVSIDTAATSSLAETRSGYTALCDDYRKRGLLRRVRGEGSVADLLATIYRIVEDMNRAQQAPDADPFTARLRAIAETAPSAPVEPQAVKPSETTDTVKRPTPAMSGAVENKEESGLAPGWKRTAEQKGRIRRRTGAGNKSIGGRKPGGIRKP
jgi:hypothetical protein